MLCSLVHHSILFYFYISITSTMQLFLQKLISCIHNLLTFESSAIITDIGYQINIIVPYMSALYNKKMKTLSSAFFRTCCDRQDISEGNVGSSFANIVVKNSAKKTALGNRMFGLPNHIRLCKISKSSNALPIPNLIYPFTSHGIFRL